MRATWIAIGWLAFCGFCSSASFAYATPVFIGLGGVPATSTDGISADGGTVVGTIAPAFIAFKWTDGVKTQIGTLPQGYDLSQAFGVSADGETFVGALDPPNAATPKEEIPRAFTWTAGVIDILPDLDGGIVESWARDISDDAGTIVGYSSSGQGQEAALWNETGVVGLGGLQGVFAFSDARAVSADGSVVVGVAGVEDESITGSGLGCESGFGPTDDLAIEAFRRVGGQMVGLGHLPGGGAYSAALGVNPTGAIVVGESDSANGDCEAFSWRDGVMTSLGHFPGGSVSSAYDVSADGSIVVGTGLTQFFERRAFIWDEKNGLRDLQEVLVEEYGISELAEWVSILVATGISDDGNAITAYGFNANQPTSDFEAFVVYLTPEPSTAPLQAAALAILGLVSRRRSLRGP